MSDPITIKELISINTQLHLDGIVPACAETLGQVCRLAIAQHAEIERMRPVVEAALQCRNGPFSTGEEDFAALLDATDVYTELLEAKP